MTRLISIVVVYHDDINLVEDLVPVFEEQFKRPIDVGVVVQTGNVCVCVFSVSVPNSFALHKVQRKLNNTFPNVSICVLERFKETWWRRYGWNVAISVWGGMAVILFVEIMRSTTGLWDIFR